ncbi:hypothetical protein TNCV_36471 [Trichonephila clavipes]|nr:hypothetical protein TNCV_36471 [Trichonephila clavipes]
MSRGTMDNACGLLATISTVAHMASASGVMQDTTVGMPSHCLQLQPLDSNGFDLVAIIPEMLTSRNILRLFEALYPYAKVCPT